MLSAGEAVAALSVSGRGLALEAVLAPTQQTASFPTTSTAGMAEDTARLICAASDRLTGASTRQRAALAGLLDLKRTDVIALDHLTRREELTPSELARFLALSSGGATAVIDRLAAAGYIARRRGAGARRRVLLRATVEGRSATRAPLAALAADVVHLASRLSPSDRHLVESFLACLADIAERHAERLIAEAEFATIHSPQPPVLWG